MVETTSGTTNFNLPVDEIIQEAYSVLGGEHTTGYDSLSARRVLNLLMIEIQNKGVPLGNMKEHTLELEAGTRTYQLPGDRIDIFNAYIRDINEAIINTQTDFTINRLSLFDYNRISNKETRGRPTQFVVHKKRDNIVLYLYPSPEKVYSLIYWSSDKIEDITASHQKLDISTRYKPAIVAGLAYKLSFKRSGISRERVIELKEEFNEQLHFANSEDRERTNYIITPTLKRNY